MKHLFFMILLSGLSHCLWAQTIDEAISKGNDYYKAEQYDMAEKQYRAALAQNGTNITVQYNLANALSKQKNMTKPKRY